MMKKSQLLDFALFELNREAAAAQTFYIQNVGLDETEAMYRAVSNDLSADIARIEKEFNVKLHLDDNYSMTIGPNMYGVYESLEQMQEVAYIIEGGF